MRTSGPVYWLSPLRGCDVCDRDFLDIMYDAKTVGGPWGNLCEDCFKTGGVGLGVGLGQMYRRQPDGRFLCVEGLE
ncbi:hypothetical protein D3C71_1144800 [compost metagenome]